MDHLNPVGAESNTTLLERPARGADSLDALRNRVRGEFLEMPGLSLTCVQAARLLGMPPAVCATILTSLVERGDLRVTVNGQYVRTERFRR